MPIDPVSWEEDFEIVDDDMMDEWKTPQASPLWWPVLPSAWRSSSTNAVKTTSETDLKGHA